jgi:hypothetical protein
MFFETTKLATVIRGGVIHTIQHCHLEDLGLSWWQMKADSSVANE